MRLNQEGYVEIRDHRVTSLQVNEFVVSRLIALMRVPQVTTLLTTAAYIFLYI